MVGGQAPDTSGPRRRRASAPSMRPLSRHPRLLLMAPARGPNQTIEDFERDVKGFPTTSPSPGLARDWIYHKIPAPTAFGSLRSDGRSRRHQPRNCVRDTHRDPSSAAREPNVRSPGMPRRTASGKISGLQRAAVLAFVIRAVVTRADRLPPPRVVAVPGDGFGEAVLKAHPGRPAQRADLLRGE